MSPLQRDAPPAPDPRLARPLALAAKALLVLAALAFLLVGANGPADPRLAGAPALSEEFGEVAFRVTPGPGVALPSPDSRCALLAETDAQRATGLTGRRDLGGYDAMLFRFPQDTTASFVMRGVPVPLSIAWFDAGGRFVAAADMAPCEGGDGCPTYSPGRAYRFALEVPEGALPGLGVGPGSVLSVDGECARR